MLLLISMTVCFTVQSAEQGQQISDTSANSDVDTETKDDINARDADGYTVLHRAIMNANLIEVSNLLDDSSLDLTVKTLQTEDLPELSLLLLAAETWQSLEAEVTPPFESSLHQTNKQKKGTLEGIITLLKSKRLIASTAEITQFQSRHPDSTITPQLQFSLYGGSTSMKGLK